MKHLHLLFLAGALLTASCIKEDWGVIPNQQSNNEQTKGWNKHKTIDFYVLSSLNDKSTTNTDAVSDFLNKKGEACSIGVVERSDVLNYTWYSFCRNLSTELSVKTARFASFALHRYNGGSIEGSTVLLNHKLNTEESFKITDDCYIKFVPIMAKSNVAEPVNILVPFATTRFTSAQQITAAVPTLTRLAGNAYGAVLIGSVKTSLTDNLKTAVAGVSNAKLTFASQESDKDYALFVIAPPSWVLRETIATPLSGINAYCLSIEASVE